MRIPALTLLFAAGLAASGCATRINETSGTPSVVAASGAPVPIDGLDWHSSVDGDEARLAYGPATSEAVDLGFSCIKQSGRLDLFAVTQTGTEGIFHLESGGDTERYPAIVEPFEPHDDLYLSGSAAASDPVFQRFRALGWIALWTRDQRRTLVAQPGSQAQIERFFAYCG